MKKIIRTRTKASHGMIESFGFSIRIITATAVFVLWSFIIIPLYIVLRNKQHLCPLDLQA